MKQLCALVALAVGLAFAVPALAREEITRFDVQIDVERDGDIVVTETIDVIAEGADIRHGIFRDLPRYYESNGERLPYDYDVLSIRRDGHDEHYEASNEGNARHILIGDADRLVEYGAHTYEIRYRVKNQVRYFDGYDEIYWNVTGNYWLFPILEASAAIVLPPGAHITGAHGYTGAMGKGDSDYVYSRDGDRHLFRTTRPLAPHEGLTVALGFEKGLIDPPSASDEGAIWWQRYGALAILVASLGGLFFFLYRNFERVGRDPVKGPVFPRYEAPEGLSPAAAHRIYYRALSGNRALIATLLNLAVKGQIKIDADKKTTELTRLRDAPGPEGIPPEDLSLERSLFAGGDRKTLGGSYDPGFTSAYAAFQAQLSRKYGSTYFRWNVAYTLLALAITVAIIVFAITQTVNWTIWHTLGVVALAALNAVFMYLMPAPTPLGQQVRTEIEGFRLYMDKAEKLQLNAVDPTVAAPPPMTTERYEKFLPYAVALGVEEPWTRHFQHVLPEEAARYNPTWTNMSAGVSLGALSSSLVANMNSGVASSLPQSSSSSGSGGGGFSGGGGGGGGGGGW